MAEAQPNPPSDALLRALGRLVLAHSEVEESLRAAIALNVGTDLVAAEILTAGISFRSLVDKFGALYREVNGDPSYREMLRAFCNHLSDLNEQRNSLIHASWLHFDTGEVRRLRRSATPHKGLVTSSHGVAPADIEQLVATLAAADTKLWAYVSESSP